MSTYAQMQSKIADDLNRSDLTSQIKREINRAIRKYSKYQFFFNSTQASFKTLVNKFEYAADGTVVGIPSDIRSITYLRVDQSTSPVIYTDTGAADAYVISPGTATSYSSGDTYRFIPTNTNTGASTINIDAVGAANIKRQNGDDPAAGDLKANQVYTIIYDGTNFVLRNSTSAMYYEMTPRAIDQVLGWNVNNNTGLPLEWAWHQQKIFMYPVPDNSYEVTIFYDREYTDLSADGDSNDFTTNTEAEQLIEQEVEYQIYNTIILDQEMAFKCMKNRDECLKSLRQTSVPFLNVYGHVRATDF